MKTIKSNGIVYEIIQDLDGLRIRPFKGESKESDKALDSLKSNLKNKDGE